MSARPESCDKLLNKCKLFHFNRVNTVLEPYFSASIGVVLLNTAFSFYYFNEMSLHGCIDRLLSEVLKIYSTTVEQILSRSEKDVGQIWPHTRGLESSSLKNEG